METFCQPKQWVHAPDFSEQRQLSLRQMNIDEVDAPIAELIASFALIPWCYTLQSCYGHFLYPGQTDKHLIAPLPVFDSTTTIHYRIAYIALCVENSASGKKLVAGLKRIPVIDPDHIQFGSAEWFWERQANSFVIQVIPARHMTEDTAWIGYDEALHVEKIKTAFFDHLVMLAEEHVSNIPPGDHGA